MGRRHLITACYNTPMPSERDNLSEKQDASQHENAKRWRWQFSLRTLLLCTTIVALAICWWGDRKRHLHQVEQLRAKVFVLEGEINYREAKRRVSAARPREIQFAIPPNSVNPSK